jgi:hypothetical protein
VRGAWQMLSMVRRQPRCVPLDDVPEIRNWVQVQHHRRAGARSTEHHRRAGRTQADPSCQTHAGRPTCREEAAPMSVL